MLLRRVVAHARRQDWMAIAIEFVLLVLGVFLGIQVANWNEARRGRTLEAEYIARLLPTAGKTTADAADALAVAIAHAHHRKLRRIGAAA